MKKTLILTASILSLFLAFLLSLHIYRASVTPSVSAEHLRTEYTLNPMGLDTAAPRFSWQLHDQNNTRGQRQTAYRLVVAQSESALEAGPFLWDTGRVESSACSGLTYAGPELTPASRYYWKVTVWDKDGESVTSAEESWFETGLMDRGWEGASMISCPLPPPSSFPNTEGTSFAIDLDMKIRSKAAAFVYGFNDEYVYYRFQLETDSQNTVSLRMSQCKKYMTQKEEITDLSQLYPDPSALPGQIIHMRIEVWDTLAQIYLDGAAAAEFQVEPGRLERFGIIHDSSTASGGDALFDNITVTDADGTVLIREDFQDPKHTIFSPEYPEITPDGWLHMSCGTLLTPDPYEQPAAPMFRYSFTASRTPVSARLYTTALGVTEFRLNGRPASEEYLSPGRLAYNKRLLYRTYDVTGLLQEGENALGVTLGHGWYDRAVGYPGAGSPWGDTLAFQALLLLTYEDGSAQTIVTGPDWKCFSDGPVRKNDIYQGETYDATKEMEGWDTASFDDASWTNAVIHTLEEFQTGVITSQPVPPIRNTQILKPVGVTEPLPGTYVYDFGQNFAGICRIRLTGTKGQMVTLRHGETLNTEALLNPDDAPGTIWTANQLGAANTDRYICRGDQEGETFEPSLTLHGFRYVQITGLDGPLPLSDVEGLVLTSDLESAGSFECSDESINRLYQNILWSQTSNFTGGITDCPQRDERFGWTGDAQVYCLTAAYNSQVYQFMDKFLTDMRDIQREDGAYPDMAPRNFNTHLDGSGGNAGSNGWGDAGVAVTWQMYQQYGDTAIIRKNYEAMCKWLVYLADTTENYIRDDSSFGDHLALEPTPGALIDTAWCSYSFQLMSRMAEAIGQMEDSAKFAQIAGYYRDAWNRHFVLPDGRTQCDSQTSYVLGLQMELFPEQLRQAAADRLALLVEENGFHPTTGFLGVNGLLPSLSQYGHADTAYALVEQKQYPSWLYYVEQGATTIYESWYTSKPSPDGSYTLDGSMNHFTFGSIGSWFYSDVLGIGRDGENPGFRHVKLRPRPGGSLTYAKGSYESVYGVIFSSWTLDPETGAMTYDVTLPPGSTASLTLPKPPNGMVWKETGTPDAASPLSPGGYSTASSAPYPNSANFTCFLESGSYHFITETAAGPLPE